MPQEFQFTRNQFVKLRATIKVHVGSLERDLWPDDEIEFDGQILKHNGETFAAPQLRGAFKAGWIVLAEDVETTYVPKPAGVQVRPAQDTGSKEKMVIETVDDEERIVGDVSSANIGGRPKPVDIGGAEQGVEVGRVGVPAKQRTVIKDAADAQRRTKALDDRQRVAATAPVRPPEPKPKKAAPQKKAKGKTPAKKKDNQSPAPLELGDGLKWSFDAPWRVRAKRAKEEFSDNPEALKKIKDAETSIGVQKAVTKLLDASS